MTDLSSSRKVSVTIATGPRTHFLVKDVLDFADECRRLEMPVDTEIVCTLWVPGPGIKNDLITVYPQFITAEHEEEQGV
jgi:hypothetical protein